MAVNVRTFTSCVLNYIYDLLNNLKLILKKDSLLSVIIPYGFLEFPSPQFPLIILSQIIGQTEPFSRKIYNVFPYFPN